MATISVGTAAALQNALLHALGGDTILLQPGAPYSGLGLDHLPAFDPPVTVTSADPANRAVLTNFNIGIDSPSIGGLTFRGLDFQVVMPCACAFNIYGGRHITFDKNRFYGPDGAPDPNGEAIRFFDSQYITFTDNEIKQVAHGLTIARSDHLIVTGNHIHDVNSDTMDFAQVSDAMISGNALHDFHTTDDNHPDAMQFGTAGSTTPSHDVTIRDNLIYRGAGNHTQGIFMGDEIGTLPFQNFTISGNLIVDTGWSAIRATHNVGLMIAGNELLTVDPNSISYILAQFSDQVTISNNKALQFSADDTCTNVSLSGNQQILQVTQADADARIQKWFADHPTGAWATTPPPPPAPDPRDAQIADLQAQLSAAIASTAAAVTQSGKYAAGLNAVIRLGTAANAKRQGPTKADMAGIIAAAKTALQ